MLVATQKRVYTDALVSQVNKNEWLRFWALFDGLSSWAKENKPNTYILVNINNTQRKVGLEFFKSNFFSLISKDNFHLIYTLIV